MSQRFYKRLSFIKPFLQLFFSREPSLLDHHPSLHRLSCDVEGLDEKESLRASSAFSYFSQPQSQEVLVHAAEHVSVEKMTDASEHLFAVVFFQEETIF